MAANDAYLGSVLPKPGDESVRGLFARRRSDALKLETALRLLHEIQLSNAEDMLSGVLVLEHRGTKRMSQLATVRACARAFGRAPFSIGELCARAETIFPGSFLARRIASRRLHDLKKEGLIEIVSAELPEDGSLAKRSRTNRYRYTGPP